MAGPQRGLGTFGALVVLAILIAGGYYLYKNVLMAPAEAPSCKAALSDCIANCRKTNTEAQDVQTCQQRCSRTAEECEQKR